MELGGSLCKPHRYASCVHFISLACDSMGGCSDQGLTQHNGIYGCNYCLIQSTAVLGQPGKRVYLPQYPLPRPRPNDNYQNCLKFRQYRNLGVQHRSNLLYIPNFDVITNCPIDYMHCVHLGVIKYFTVNWFDSKNHSQSYYLGLDDIDILLEKVAVPNEILRTIRSLKILPFWKASEWRTWLRIAPIILQGYLP